MQIRGKKRWEKQSRNDKPSFFPHKHFPKRHSTYHPCDQEPTLLPHEPKAYSHQSQLEMAPPSLDVYFPWESRACLQDSLSLHHRKQEESI
jgi:hypothetical protein